MAVQGSQRFAVLLCRFSESEDENMQDEDYFRDFFIERGTGGLNDYWVDASLGSINLDGSEVFDWKTLKQTRDQYIADRPSRWDKIQGAIDAFGLDHAPYQGVVAIFNAPLGDSAASGKGVLAGPDDVNLTFMAHETGHVLSLEHSYDQSDRKLISWSAPGEYYDNYDIMSAMNVFSFRHQRFNDSGPRLNVVNLDRMEWLPASRVYTPQYQNSSQSDTFDLVSLSYPEISGYLAARIGALYLEFRTPDRWDAGIGFPVVLVHQWSDVNSIIIASDLENNVNHWQPGQIIGPSEVELAIRGGTRIQIHSFDLAAKKARITITQRARRPYVVGPGQIFGGVAEGGGGILILPGGRPVPVPPHSPLVRVMEKIAIAAEAERILDSSVSEIVTDAVLSDLVRSLQQVKQRNIQF